MGKHVIILGNGFDKFLNRPTSYAEFYDSKYCPKRYPAPLIHYLNDYSIGGQAAGLRWYDFENHLLAYLKSEDFKKSTLPKEDIDVINYILSKSIPLSPSELVFRTPIRDYYDAFQPFLNKGYIKPVEDGKKYVLAFDKFDEEPILRDLYAFSYIKQGLISYLNENVSNEVDNDILRDLLTNKNVEIYTFNYTKVPFADSKKVHYVHGSCVDNNIILGTREEKDIDEFYRYFQKVFDPKYHPAYVLSDLLDAERVTIFGHSLGENDSQYFEDFFKRQCDSKQAKKIPIVIITKDQQTVMDIKYSLQVLTNYRLSYLYQNSKLVIVPIENVSESKLRSFLQLVNK